jgi:hypothetical protein
MLADRRGAKNLALGAALATRLADTPIGKRPLTAPLLMRQLGDGHAVNGLLLLDNIELLFERALRLDPLDLLKHQAHVRRVVAVWPGEMHDGRLTYARQGHPEHRDYGLSGFVHFVIQ